MPFPNGVCLVPGVIIVLKDGWLWLWAIEIDDMNMIDEKYYTCYTYTSSISRQMWWWQLNRMMVIMTMAIATIMIQIMMMMMTIPCSLEKLRQKRNWSWKSCWLKSLDSSSLPGIIKMRDILKSSWCHLEIIKNSSWNHHENIMK